MHSLIFCDIISFKKPANILVMGEGPEKGRVKIGKVMKGNETYISTSSMTIVRVCRTLLLFYTPCHYACPSKDLGCLLHSNIDRY